MNTELTTNLAGGPSYSLEGKAALAQYALTGTFAGTFYATARTQLEKVKTLCASVDNEFIAKLAIYAKQYGMMKDSPVFLVAYLAANSAGPVFHQAFDQVIRNARDVRKFTTYMRDGTFGRKSLGSAPKRAVQRWFSRQSPERLYWQSIGQEGVSLGDVINMAHPKPTGEEQNAMFAYLTGKELPREFMPPKVAAFEDFKAGTTTEVPDVPFQRLTSLVKGKEQWAEIARNMTWNQLRLNLNTLNRHEVFQVEGMVEYVAERLANAEHMPKHVLPFAMYSTVEYLDKNIPGAIRKAATQALENSMLHAPVFDHDVLVYVDVSGSMRNPVTGSRAGRSSSLSCAAAAAFFGGSLYKANAENCRVFRFAEGVKAESMLSEDMSLRDIITNISGSGGGTNVPSTISHANSIEATAPLVIIISDNESWYEDRPYRYWGRTGPTANTTKDAWSRYTERVPGSKLVLWDMQPYSDTQVQDTESVLNVGGYSDAVYQVIDYFSKYTDAKHWVEIIEHVKL